MPAALIGIIMLLATGITIVGASVFGALGIYHCMHSHSNPNQVSISDSELENFRSTPVHLNLDEQSGEVRTRYITPISFEKRYQDNFCPMPVRSGEHKGKMFQALFLRSGTIEMLTYLKQ